MKSFKRILRDTFDKGGVLLAGLGSLYLYKQQYIPNSIGHFSYFSYAMLSVGAIGFARHIVMDTNMETEDHQKLLGTLDQRKSEIQVNTEKLEELRTACQSFMSMGGNLEGWKGDPSLVRGGITIIEELLKARNGGTSLLATKGSTQGTLIGLPTRQGSFAPSPKGTEVAMKNWEPLVEAMDEEEIIQKVVQDVFQEMLQEVCESVLGEEYEKVLQDISQNVQKEIQKMMESELTEDMLWNLSEESEEEMMEKFHRRLFARVQADAFEMVDEETCDQDEPQKRNEFVVESLEDANFQTVNISETKIGMVASVENQKCLDEEVGEIPERKLGDVSENLPVQEFRNLKCENPKESDQSRSGNSEENLEKQEDKLQETLSSSKKKLDETVQQIPEHPEKKSGEEGLLTKLLNA